MSNPLRERIRNVIAVIAMVVIGLLTLYVILQGQRLRIPILEERPFQLKVELKTAQAVTPGQGQSIRVAGVKIGDVAAVELEQGSAVVTVDINRDSLPIYRNATVLLRPATGLKDMFLELDPGSRSAGEFSEGETIPVANTEPDTNLDEILGVLDTDTRAYLKLLLVGGGQGLEGRGRDLGQVLANLGPMTREFGRLAKEVAGRRTDLARLVHDLNVLAAAVGGQDEDVAALVTSANAVLEATASEDPSTQRAIALLPDALRSTRLALDEVGEFANVLGPTANRLRPFARNLDDVSAAMISLSRLTPVIRDELRPFARSARGPVRNLGPAARDLAASTPDLTTVGAKVNRLFNLVAYNPRGAEAPGAANRDEGYLYWVAWLGHVANSLFQTQDANGSMWRIYVTFDCESALGILAGTPLAPLLTGVDQLFAPGGPFEGGCS